MAVRTIQNSARVLLPLVLSLAGCAAPPPPPPPPVLALAPTASRLILFRSYNLIGMGAAASVQINGAPSCSLPNATAYVEDVPPGDVTITGEELAVMQTPFLAGTSKLSFTANAGQTYYVKFSPAGEALGAVGFLVEAATPGETGPYNIRLAGPADLGKIAPVGCGVSGSAG